MSLFKGGPAYTFVNIYNPPAIFTTIPTIAEVVELNPTLFSPEAAFVFLGNFNLHHALWNDPTSNTHIPQQPGRIISNRPSLHINNGRQPLREVHDIT